MDEQHSPRLAALLGALGLPANAEIAQVEERVRVLSKATAGPGRFEAEEGLRAELRRVQHQIELVNQRLITHVVDNAILAGRLLPNQREFWIGQLDKDFDGKSLELGNAGKALKVDRRVEEFMERTRAADSTSARRKEVHNRVKASMKQGLTYDEAWNQVKEAHPEIFDSMHHPETRK